MYFYIIKQKHSKMNFFYHLQQQYGKDAVIFYRRFMWLFGSLGQALNERGIAEQDKASKRKARCLKNLSL